jgi:hypothetical protein
LTEDTPQIESHPWSLTTLKHCGCSSFAAAQGLYVALFFVAECHELGLGVAADVAEAIRWYRRARAAGSDIVYEVIAGDELRRLGA